MIHRLKRNLMLPLLALGMTFVLTSPAQAQYRQIQQPNGTSASLQITFGSQPRWSTIRGSRVQQVRERERPDYDMFRYGGGYYVYRNNQWYMSRHGRGEFAVIEERNVPMEVSRVPRQHWRNYPGQWNDQSRDPRGGGNGRGNGYGNGHRDR
jgi:hypothetical protein